MEYQRHQRRQFGELRPYVEGEDLTGVSISDPDIAAGSPKPGDMIARNPKNHSDRWLVSAAYYAENFYPPRANAGMGIGEAVDAMHVGRQRVRRAGWNGKGMYLVYQAGYPEGVPINKNTAEATGIPEGTVCKFLPWIMMRTTQGDFVPWLCSQTDLLAEDWEIVEGSGEP